MFLGLNQLRADTAETSSPSRSEFAGTSGLRRDWPMIVSARLGTDGS